MTDADRELLRKRLAQKIERMKAKVADFEEMSAPVSPENSIGRISRMDAINNKAIYESALREAKKELNDLEYAFSHVDSEDFGLCRKCKGEIDIRRLMIMPGSPFCQRCAR